MTYSCMAGRESWLRLAYSCPSATSLQNKFEWTVFMDSSMQNKQNSVKVGCRSVLLRSLGTSPWVLLIVGAPAEQSSQ